MNDDPEQLIEAFKALGKNAAFAAFLAHIRAEYEAKDAVHCDAGKSAAENREALMGKLALKDLPDWPAQELKRLQDRLKKTPHGG